MWLASVVLKPVTNEIPGLWLEKVSRSMTHKCNADNVQNLVLEVLNPVHIMHVSVRFWQHDSLKPKQQIYSVEHNLFYV